MNIDTLRKLVEEAHYYQPLTVAPTFWYIKKASTK